jgi:hypothetical protein
MSKLTVARIFWGSLIAIAGGLILFLIAGGLGFAGTAFIMNGPDVVGVQSTSLTWLAALMGMIGVIALVSGGIAQLVAWIGALINTAQLADKTWFLVLLLLGIFGLGFIPMLVYVLAGPDGTAPVAPAPQSTAGMPKPA